MAQKGLLSVLFVWFVWFESDSVLELLLKEKLGLIQVPVKLKARESELFHFSSEKVKWQEKVLSV